MSLAFSCRHGDRLTVILADDLVEAYESARVFIGMADADSFELRLIAPVWDPTAVRFTTVLPE